MPWLCLRALALPEVAAPGLPRAELQAQLQAAAACASPAGAAASQPGVPCMLLEPPPDGCLDAGQALWAEVGACLARAWLAA